MSRGRSLIHALAAGALLLAALLAVLRFALPPAIERYAVDQLNEMGVPDADLKISDISLTHAVIEGVRLGEGGELEIPNLQLTLSWADLLLGRMQSLSISGLKLRLQRTEKGLSFGSLDSLFLAEAGPESAAPEQEEKETASAIGWPVSTISLRSSTVEIASPFGTTLLPFSGNITQTEEGTIRIEDARIEFVHPNLRFETAIEAGLEPNGDFSGTLTVISGSILVGDFSATLSGGTFAVTGDLTDIEGIAGDGLLTVNRMQTPLGFSPQAELRIGLHDGNLMARFAVTDAGHGTSGNLGAHVSSVFGKTPVVRFDADLSLSALEKLPQGLGLPPGLSGESTLTLSFTEPFDRFVRLAEATTPDDILKDFPATSLALKARSLHLPDHEATLAADGRLLITAENKALVIRSEDGLRLILSELQDGWFRGMLGPLYNLQYGTDLALALGNPTGPIITTALQPDKILKAAFAGKLSVSGGGLPPLDGDFAAATSVASETFRIEHFAISKAVLKAGPLTVDGITADLDTIDLTLSGSPQAFTGTVAFKTLVEGLLPGGISLDRGRAAMKGDFDFSGETLRYRPEGCILVESDGLAISDTLSVPGPLSFCMKPHQGPFLEAVWSDGAVSHVRSNIAIEARHPVVNLLPLSGPKAIVRGAPLRLLVKADGPVTLDGLRAEARLDNIDIVVPDHHLGLNGLSLRIVQDGGTQEPAADLAVREIIDYRKPAMFKPLALASSFRMQGGKVAINGKLNDTEKRISAGFEGEHVLASSSGALTFRINPMTFDKTKRQLAWQFPVLKDFVQSATGLAMGAAFARWKPGKVGINADLVAQKLSVKTTTRAVPGLGKPLTFRGGQVAVKAALLIDKGNMQSAGEILLEKISLEAGAMKAEQLNAVLALNNLWPPSTPKKQAVSVAAVKVGIPLTNGKTFISLDRDGRFRMQDLTFHMAGGTISAKKLEIGGGTTESDVTLTVKDVDLNKLIALFEVDGLNASGNLEGAIPVILKDGSLIISDAHLAVDGGGVISYIPSSGGFGDHPAAGLAMKALKNFQYSDLGMVMNGEADGRVKARFNIKGANPDLHNGYPLVLNFNVSGHLGEMLESGFGNYQVPETIKNRMFEFSQ